MKMAVDDTSSLLTSNRATIFVIWIPIWCVKWMIVMVGQSRHACRCSGGTTLRFFFLFFLLLSPPDWRYTSRICYYIWLKITFREVSIFVYNLVYPLHLNFPIFNFRGIPVGILNHSIQYYLTGSSQSMWPIRVELQFSYDGSIRNSLEIRQGVQYSKFLR